MDVRVGWEAGGAGCLNGPPSWPCNKCGGFLHCVADCRLTDERSVLHMRSASSQTRGLDASYPYGWLWCPGLRNRRLHAKRDRWRMRRGRPKPDEDAATGACADASATGDVDVIPPVPPLAWHPPADTALAPPADTVVLVEGD